MNREEVLDEMVRVAQIDRFQAAAILDLLDSIGYEGGREPGYQEASMVAVADTMGTFYMTLIAKGVPDYSATAMAVAFMNNAQGQKQ